MPSTVIARLARAITTRRRNALEYRAFDGSLMPNPRRLSVHKAQTMCRKGDRIHKYDTTDRNGTSVHVVHAHRGLTYWGGDYGDYSVSDHYYVIPND